MTLRCVLYLQAKEVGRKLVMLFRGKYFYKKVKIIPSKFCNNAKFFPRPKDPKVQKSSNVEKIFTENI